MSYLSRAYDEHNNEFGPDPVVVLVAKGTHDVSRLINLFAGSPPVIEQLQFGDQIRRQVRRHNGGRAALDLLRRHGGPDFTPEFASDEQLEELVARTIYEASVAPGRYDAPAQVRWEAAGRVPWEQVNPAWQVTFRQQARALASAGLLAVPSGSERDPDWNEAVDWLLNSRHCADPDVQSAFRALAEGRCTRDEADRGDVLDEPVGGESDG